MLKKSNPNKTEILGKGINVFFIRVLGYGFGFLFTWILANKYGPKFQGVFALAFLFLSVGTMIAKLGVEASIVKWIANTTELGKKKTIVKHSLKLVAISALIVGAVVVLIAPLVAWMYNKPNVETSIRLAGIAIPFMAILDVSANYFRGEKQTNLFSIYFHLAKFSLPFIAIGVFYMFFKAFIEVPMLSYLIGLFVLSLVITIHILILFKKTIIINDSTLTTKFIITESYPMMISSAIVMLMGWSDVFILGFFVKEETIGVYSTAIKLATVVAFIYNAVCTISTPKIASFYSTGQTKKLKETISFSSKLIFLSSLPIFVLMFCFPEPILSLFGEEYIEGKTVLRILLIAQFTNAITGPVGPVFQMTGRQKTLQNIILLALIINLVLSLILVYFYNVIGVAIASAIGMIFWNIFGAYHLNSKINIQTWIKF